MRNLIAIHCKADNDSNGNPRRFYLIYERDSGEYLGAVDEGYAGDHASSVLGNGNPIRGGDSVRILARIPSTAAFRRECLSAARREWDTAQWVD